MEFGFDLGKISRCFLACSRAYSRLSRRRAVHLSYFSFAARKSASMRSMVASVFLPSSHSQTVMTVQARVSRRWALSSSRAMLRAIFSFQNPAFVLGSTYLVQPRWPCQKQPLMKMTARYLGRTRLRAPALRLPGDYGPWGRWGINQHGELAVVEQAQRAEQLTADRDRFSLFLRGGRQQVCGRLVRPQSCSEGWH